MKIHFVFEKIEIKGLTFRVDAKLIVKQEAAEALAKQQKHKILMDFDSTKSFETHAFLIIRTRSFLQRKSIGQNGAKMIND